MRRERKPIGDGSAGHESAHAAPRPLPRPRPLARWRNGVIRPADILASADFSIDLANENYRIEFRVEGDLLSVRLWRVTAAGGSVVIAPIPLGTGPGGSASLLTVRDPLFTAGRAGVSAFARGGNSVFWDDVELGQPGDALARLALPPRPPRASGSAPQMRPVATLQPRVPE